MGFWSRLRLMIFGEPPDYAAIWAGIEPRFAGIRRDAWKPTRADYTEETRSHFGGAPLLERGEEWPRCGRCKTTMPLFLQLDSTELPPGLDDRFPSGLLQVFFCTKCWGGWTGDGREILVRARTTASGERPSLDACKDPLEAVGIGGWEPVDDYLAPGDMNTLDEGLEEDELEAFFEQDYPRMGDKLLGGPYWVQDPDRPECPHCHEPMTTIFQLDSNDNLDFMWGDAGVAHVLWCPRHVDELTLVWQCH